MTDTKKSVVMVTTTDGACPVHLHAPRAGLGFPGVLLLMDAPGIRPALHEMASRLASSGYSVAMPDLFYRAGAYEPIDVATVFTDPARRAEHRARFNATITPGKVMDDLAAILASIRDWPDMNSGKVGVVGYCMGGRLALIAAATFPDRIAVAASYHAGNLADGTPTSPHLLADRIRAKVYVAGATDDPNFPDAQKAELERALDAAEIDHCVEIYPARHGWVPRDMPAHDPQEAEHHWKTLLPLLNGVLR